MRVLQVIAVVAPHYGGPSVGSLRLNEALNRNGVKARILSTTLAGDSVELAGDDLPHLGGRELDLRLYRSSWPKSLQNSFSLIPALWREVKQCDVVHIHGQHMLPPILAFIAATLLRKPYGLQPHGGFEPYQRSQSRMRKLAYDFLVGRRLARRARYVLFASPTEAIHARSIVAPEKMFVHALGADLKSPAVRPRLISASGLRSKLSTATFVSASSPGWPERSVPISLSMHGLRFPPSREGC